MTTVKIACDQCKQPIKPGTGYIHVDKHDAWRVEKQHHQADRKLAELKGTYISAAEIPDYELRTPWEAHHQACDPHPSRDDYWFDVSRANSHAKLLSWTAHLMDKTWLPYTQWATFVRRHLTREDLAA